jgi:hypothetical protein
LAIALGEVVSPERLRIYAQDLVTDLSKEQLTAAFGRARRECKFFPKLAELREYARALANTRSVKTLKRPRHSTR